MRRSIELACRRIVLFLATSSLLGCGSNAFIAKKVRFSVTFNEAIAGVHFDLDPQYDTGLNREIGFDLLGQITIEPNEEFHSSTLSTEIHAAPSSTALPWPIFPIQKFPNGKKLPAVLRSGTLNQWTQTNDKIGVALLYQVTPDLIVGGSILSDQFNDLPEDFLATQKFYAPNGQIVASISVMGRTATSKGGILYLGNLGQNPFEISRHPESVDASEEVKIISRGQGRFPFWINIENLLSNLALELQYFR